MRLWIELTHPQQEAIFTNLQAENGQIEDISRRLTARNNPRGSREKVDAIADKVRVNTLLPIKESFTGTVTFALRTY